MKSEISDKESELENVRTEREAAAQELESAKHEREELMQKAKEYEEQLAQQQTHELEIGRELEVSGLLCDCLSFPRTLMHLPSLPPHHSRSPTVPNRNWSVKR